MKPIWYKIGMACILVGAVARMADNPLAVVILLGAIAVFFLIVQLYDKGKIRISERVKTVLKKIGAGIVVTVGGAYLLLMGGYSVYSALNLGEWQGIFILAFAGIVCGISWYMSRWRRWWVRFLKTFTPKDKICYGDWKLRDKYYHTFDYTTNAQYGLRINDRIFEGRARIWLDRQDIYASLKLNNR